MIFVYYPRGHETGGPEALHQLVDSMRRQGLDAYLTPLPGTEGGVRVSEYQKYDAPEAIAVDGHSIVVPEISIDLLGRFSDSEKYIWWLAAGSPDDTEGARHLVQSEYAADTVRSAGLKPNYLSDYTVVPRIVESANGGSRISYNGSKGAALVEAVKSYLPDVEWCAISGMSKEEVSACLSSSAVYLDLGHHPGKDRMPREAAALGAVTVVGKAGSAKYSQDVPITEKVDRDNPEAVANLLNEILSGINHYFTGQYDYRQAIACEREVFDQEVLDIFT